MNLQGANVLMGISGGIAAYKSPLVVRLLVKAGAQVRVVLTGMAQQFVTPLTLAALSQHEVGTNEKWLDEKTGITHIRWAEEADVALIAPATANILGKAAHGIADDILTSLLLAVTCPVLLVPSMHHQMWNNRVVQGNVSRLRELGFEILEPEVGDLASGDTGPGRMPEPEAIVTALRSLPTKRNK